MDGPCTCVVCDDLAVEPGPRSFPLHQDVAVVGLDLAKRVFQVHAVGRDGQITIRHKLCRGEALAFFSSLPLCLVGMEACVSAHHLARDLEALGHDDRRTVNEQHQL